LLGVVDVYDIDDKLAGSVRTGLAGMFRDLLACNGDPVSVWTQGNISDGQGGSVEYLFKLSTLDGVLAHCAVLRSSNEETILHAISVVLVPKSFTYTRYDCRVVLLAVVDCVRFIV
jgi:hypothetical protein